MVALLSSIPTLSYANGKASCDASCQLIDKYYKDTSLEDNKDYVLFAAGEALKEKYDPLKHQEKINKLQSQIKNVEVVVKDIDVKISSLERDIVILEKVVDSFDDLERKQNQFINKLGKVIPTSQRKEMVSRLKKDVNKLRKQKNAWSSALTQMRQGVEEMNSIKINQQKINQQNIKTVDDLKKTQHLNRKINSAGGFFLAGISSILDSESLQHEAAELQASYPELNLAISSDEYWAPVVKDIFLDGGTSFALLWAEIGISQYSKLAGKVFGKLFGVGQLFFEDIPQGSYEVHDLMPNPKDKENFLRWVKVVGDMEKYYLDKISDSEKFGTKLSIPRGIIQFWQLRDIASGDPDPSMEWVHKWKFDKNGSPSWTGGNSCIKPTINTKNQCISPIALVNQNNTLNIINRNLNYGTSHFGVANNTWWLNKPADKNQNPRQTIQENHYLAKGTMTLEAPADIVLRWGNHPADLDSHLTGPVRANSSERFHIHFENKGSLTGNPNAMLYRDDTSHGAGSTNRPEQTRINVTQPGVYNFYVHDFSNKGSQNSKALSQSGATVTLYSAGNRNLPEGNNLGKQVGQPIPVPKDKVGTVWHSFELDTRRNTLTPKDTMSNDKNIIK